jgi:hypothetical protein
MFASLLFIFAAGVTPASAICIVGIGSCDPTEGDGRAALEGTLRAFLPGVAFNIQSFRKTNGISVPPEYLMDYVATIEFPNGVAPPSRGVTGDLVINADIQGRLMGLRDKGFRVVSGGDIRQRGVMSVNSRINFVKSERGWVYSTGL